MRKRQRKTNMKKSIIAIAIFVVALTLILSGCGGGEDSLEGKNIVTFETNGGTLDYGTSSTNQKINFAYHPGTYIVDPTTMPNYSISRNGYHFTGWYTSPDCKESEKWDFTSTFDVEQLTLYAGWEKAIRYSYTVCYEADGEIVSLGSYQVSAGDKFDDWRKFANARKNYTGIGFYTDPGCTVAWDAATTHPGGESDLDIPVYVKYIEGEWELVDNYEKLKAAVKNGNVYLTADIDCEGNELFFTGTFNKVFEGNGYAVKNFTVNKSGTVINPSLAIFQTIGATADIRNVAFEDVTFNFFDIRESSETITVKANVAALTVSMLEGAKVSSVSVSGVLHTNYNGELPCLDKAFYYTDEADAALMAGVTDFTADIIVDKQS